MNRKDQLSYYQDKWKKVMPKVEYNDEMRKKYTDRKKAKRFQGETETESSVIVRRHHREEKPKAQQSYTADLPEAAKPRMKKYPKVSADDYEVIKGEWEDVDKLVENSRENAVVFVGSVTDEDRTKTSADIYNDLFEEKYRNREDVVLISKEDIQKIVDEAKQNKSPARTVLRNLKEMIASHPDKKIIFSYPYLLKDLGLRPDFYHPQNGTPTPFHLAINMKAGDDPDLGALCWFQEKGKIALGPLSIEGPEPDETAKRQLEGIANFMRITRFLAPDRQGMRVSFGHGWNLDALAIYLAKGKVGAEEFGEVLDGKIFGNAKGFDITVEKNGEIKMHCRGKEFMIPVERLI